MNARLLLLRWMMEKTVLKKTKTWAVGKKIISFDIIGSVRREGWYLELCEWLWSAVGLGLEAALADLPEDCEGLGWDFLPVQSHVFTRVWMISAIQAALTYPLIGQFGSLRAVITPPPANGSFDSRSCLLDTSIFRSQHFLLHRAATADAGGGDGFNEEGGW